MTTYLEKTKALSKKLNELYREWEAIELTPFNEREFSEAEGKALGFLKASAEQLATYVGGQTFAHALERSKRFDNRVRFFVCEEGDFTFALNSNISGPWLGADLAFKDRNRRQANNDKVCAPGYTGPSRSKPKKYVVYGYTPTTGRFLEYKTEEEAVKDAWK